MMDGDGQAIAAKTAPQWADAAALRADIYALEHPDEDPVRTAAAVKRVTIALRVAATKGCTRVAPLFPAIGRQRAEKATPERKMRAAIYAEIILRIEPLMANASARERLTIAQIHRAIDGLIEAYAANMWPNQSGQKLQPPRGEYGFDDLFWRLFRLRIPPKVSRPTIDAIIKKHLSCTTKRRRN